MIFSYIAPGNQHYAHMKRLISVLFAILCVLRVSAQFSFYDYAGYEGVPEFCNSRYYNCSEEQEFKATAVLDATVMPEAGIVRLATASVPARLYIVPEPDEVYDCSYKTYYMEYAGYKVEYTVYANADRLMVGYGGKEYWLDCIEGACDVYIKNLSRQYINHDDGEELFLEVTGDFPLVAQDGSIITLKRGSKFRFRVFEPGEKEHINCVVETEISKEEFVAAYNEREKYNIVRDTMLTDDIKAMIVDRIVATFDEELRGYYECGDYLLHNIGRIPTGCYIADAIGISCEHAYLLDENLNVLESMIGASYASAYSDDGIYVGCEGFDCDPCAKLHFYKIADSGKNRITELAEYTNLSWKLPYECYPHHAELLEKEYISTPIVWWCGALYCAGITSSWNSSRACFYRLELCAGK